MINKGEKKLSTLDLENIKLIVLAVEDHQHNFCHIEFDQCLQIKQFGYDTSKLPQRPKAAIATPFILILNLIVFNRSSLTSFIVAVEDHDFF